MLELISKNQIIAIIGMAKNVGKTTTLNYLLEKLQNQETVGLTSVGRDGESRDLVFDTPKPKIYVSKGAIIATSTSSLKLSDFTKQILETTGMNTSMGEVVIVRALSAGFVDLAGPTYNEQMDVVINLMKKHGCKKILIDGAVGRKAIASIDNCDGVILCTGAAYSSNIKTVVDDTEHMVNILTLNQVTDNIAFNKLLSSAKVTYIYQDNSFKQLKLKTILSAGRKIAAKLTRTVSYLLLDGALTAEFIKALQVERDKIGKLTIVVKHPTNCLYNQEYRNILERLNVDIKVIKPVNLLCLTLNPTSPYGYHFDEGTFLARLRKKVSQPLYNVKRDHNE
jgi:hypothetical protein